MSYQVLARKWRPKSFAEVVGQQHVLQVLANALTLGRVHHAYLFSGTRGVGKTSIARLLAKGLNCETGITATPCGECDNCHDIEQGNFIDLLEIDAASRTKVEDTREILDNIQYMPSKGRFKVYLIDEVHMLSRSSFNALLKTLEEPPEHVKFLLATTDPQKLPITILSRCLHLHLNILSVESISQQLDKILKLEQINSDAKAIQLLAKSANGSMRDALSLTDQAIALGNGAIDTQSVALMLGSLDSAIPFALVEALHQADASSLMQHISAAAKQGADWDTLLADTITLLHQIALLQVVPTAIGDYIEYEERIRFLAQYMAPNDVQLFYQILLMGRKELAFAPDRKIGVEMSFLRAIAFQVKTNVSSASSLTMSPTIEKKITNEQGQGHKKVPQPALIAPQSSIQPAAKQQENSLANNDIAQSNVINKPVKVDPDPESMNMPSATKNILAVREQLIQEEQQAKKSKAADKPQPLIKENLQVVENNANEEADEIEEVTAENYQWQASGLLIEKEDKALGAKEIRQALEHEKTAEMVKKLIEEVSAIDSWTAEIELLEVMPLIKQIAVNSFLESVSATQLVLHLRTDMAYLIKSSANLAKLENAVSAHRQQTVKLQVVLDDDESYKTPLEMREALYQKKLVQAKQIINQDEKVAMICQYFAGQIDENSIRPV